MDGLVNRIYNNFKGTNVEKLLFCNLDINGFTDYELDLVSCCNKFIHKSIIDLYLIGRLGNIYVNTTMEDLRFESYGLTVRDYKKMVSSINNTDAEYYYIDSKGNLKDITLANIKKVVKKLEGTDIYFSLMQFINNMDY